MDRIVKPAEAGNKMELVAALRRKAEEYLRLAATARDPVAWSELHRLAEDYLARAAAEERRRGRPDNDNQRQDDTRGERTG